MKAENFRKSNSFIDLPNIEPQGSVPGSGNASMSKMDMAAASRNLGLVGRQMIRKERKKNFMINCDEGSRGNAQETLLEINRRGAGMAWEDLFVQVTSELSPEG